MPVFKIPLTLPMMLIPAFCCGVLFMGLILFMYIGTRSRERLHLALAFMVFTGLGFVAGEFMVLYIGGWLKDPAMGMQAHRVEQIAGALFIGAIPLFLHGFLELRPNWKRVNLYLGLVGLALGLAIVVVAIVQPDLYVSQTVHRADWLTNEADHGRGQEGILYLVRDAFLGLLIIYVLVCYVADMVIHRRLRYLLPAFLGVLFAIHGAVVDIISVYAHDIYDIFPSSRHSRFTVGMTLFILFSMGAALRRFLDMGREVARAREQANREAEISRRQNEFIRGALSGSASALVAKTEALSSTMAVFTENSQEQAAATEEVSASIEEITAGVDSVMTNAEEQSQGIENLAVSMVGLSASIGVMGGLVNDALGMMKQISQNAASGEQSLRVMNESMININRSSGEITGIVQIINDISDRINLLSLNAAIEAARAGDAGRGFAVVADEISKLADQTASSIKNIDNLIRTNEKEISTGIHNITQAVERIDLIMSGIEKIVAKINDISGQMDAQTASSETANDSTVRVKAITEQIMVAMSQQRLAMGEISHTIGSINERSQQNTQKIYEITEASKGLVSRVETLNDEIESFSDGEVAVNAMA